MTAEMDRLERLIEELRSQVRRSVADGDRVRARALRAELRSAQQAWDEAVSRLEEQTEPATAAQPQRVSGPLLPAREQVHQVLELLGVPAAPRLISAVHGAFLSGVLAGTRLTSLRRDEERSFRSAPHSRPYYICAALTADLLAPARGLLAVSAWPMERRVIGPLSSRVDFLTAAVNLAERLDRAPDPGTAAWRLLWRFAANIPAAAASPSTMTPQAVVLAARSELEVHRDGDQAHRASAARRARAQLNDAEQLFGSGLRISGQASGA